MGQICCGLLGAAAGAGKLRGCSHWAVLGSPFSTLPHQAGIVTSPFPQHCQQVWSDAGVLPVLLVLRVSDIGSALWRSSSNIQPCELGQETARVETSLCPHQEMVLLALCSECAHRTPAVALPGTGAAVWMFRTFLCVSQPSLVPGPCLSACED